MALKLNINPDIEREMECLVPRTSVRSKTEYINLAIREYNVRIKRQLELKKLGRYFSAYQEEGKSILNEFAKIRAIPD